LFDFFKIKDKSLRYQIGLFSILLIGIGSLFTFGSILIENYILYKETHSIYFLSVENFLKDKTKDIYNFVKIRNKDVNKKILTDKNFFHYMLEKENISLKDSFLPIIDKFSELSKDNIFLLEKLDDKFTIIASNKLKNKRIRNVVLNSSQFQKAFEEANFYILNINGTKYYGYLDFLKDNNLYAFLNIEKDKILNFIILKNILKVTPYDEIYVFELSKDNYNLVFSQGNKTYLNNILNETFKKNLELHPTGILKTGKIFYFYIYYKPLNYLIVAKLDPKNIIDIEKEFKKRFIYIVILYFILITLTVLFAILLSFLFSSHLNSSISYLANITSKLSQGDLSLINELNEDKFPSKELKILARNIKDTIGNLNYLFTEVNRILNKIKQGELNNIKVDHKNMEGLYKDILSLLEDIISELQKVIFKIKRVSEEISKGNLDVDIDEKKFHGEYKQILNNLNRIIEYLSFKLKKAEEIIFQNQNLQKFRNLVESDNLEDIYERIFYLFKKTFNIKNFTLYEIDHENNKLKLIFSSLENIPCCQDIFSNADVCRAKKVGKLVVSDNKWGPVCKCFNLKKKYHICKPIVLGQGIKYIINVVCDTQEEIEQVKEKLKEIKKYFDVVLPIIETKKLLQSFKEKSLKDELTGLYNRRFLEEYLDRIVPLAKEQNIKLGILMIDIDYFKKVNDAYGHDIGDIVLKTVAGIIKSQIRQSDVCIRYGGEEFMVILYDIKNEKNLLNIAEKIRKKVENTIISTPKGNLKKTVSIGAALYPDDAEHIWQAIKFADVALYKAKESGRNRVVKFQPEMWQQGDEY